jgi:hypothetical protein
MNITPFTVKKTNQKKGIEGILVQFDNGKGRITFEDFLDGVSEAIYELRIEEKLNDAGNFIAAFVQGISPDTYRNIVIDGKKTKIIHKDENKKDENKIINRFNGIDFDNVEQTVIDSKGNKISLKELLAFETIEIPNNDKYTRDAVLNAILAHNNTPANIDRHFIKVLSSTAYRILEKMKSKHENSIIVSFSKYDKKGFKTHATMPTKKNKHEIFLEIRKEHFNKI